MQLRVVNKDDEDEDDDVEEVEEQLEENPSSKPQATLRQRERFMKSETGVERQLSQHRQVQEEMTQDLLNMASSLKSSSVAFGEALSRDNKVGY